MKTFLSYIHTWLLVFVCSLMSISTLSAEGFQCEGEYPQHLQGFASDSEAVYWSFTNVLVKTDRTGKIIKKIDVPSHHGDCCVLDGKLYIATHLGWPSKGRTSWIYVYNCADLSFITRVAIPEFDYRGVDGITFHDGYFYVCIGKDPDDPTPFNLILKTDKEFKIIQKIEVPGKTTYGVQAFTWANGSFWLGTYSNLGTIQCDADLKVVAQHKIDASTGIYELPPSENGEPRVMISRHFRSDGDPKRNCSSARSAVLRDGKLVWE